MPGRLENEIRGRLRLRNQRSALAPNSATPKWQSSRETAAPMPLTVVSTPAVSSERGTKIR
jgi:hypothetical protein